MISIILVESPPGGSNATQVRQSCQRNNCDIDLCCFMSFASYLVSCFREQQRLTKSTTWCTVDLVRIWVDIFASLMKSGNVPQKELFRCHTLFEVTKPKITIIPLQKLWLVQGSLMSWQLSIPARMAYLTLLQTLGSFDQSVSLSLNLDVKELN